MARSLPRLDPTLIAFIQRQQVFFVASAPQEGRVNLSPKGMDSFRVIDERHVGYLDLTGSGNETAAHRLENGRLTFMFCAFEGPPMILRLYGTGRAVRRNDPEWNVLRGHFGPSVPGERQLIMATIESVQTSCGFGVPEFTFAQQRDHLVKWAERKGNDALIAYRQEKNTTSIDGKATGHPLE